MSDKNITPLSTLIGSRISARRTKLGYTQKKLAEESKLTESAISMIEKGTRIPSVPTVRILSLVLGLPLDTLLFTRDELIARDSIRHRFGEISESESKRLQTLYLIMKTEVSE